MEIKMKCCLCKKIIEDRDNYFENFEWKNKKLIDKTYYHRTCWDKFTNQLNSANSSLLKSKELLNGMGNYMKKLGIIPNEEVVVI